MIIKTYRDDGSPDLARWHVICDAYGCPQAAPLMGSTAWFIPGHPKMPCYCPACLENHAADLIEQVLHCPACGSVHIRLNITNPATGCTRCSPNYADCPLCGLILMLADDPGHSPGSPTP